MRFQRLLMPAFLLAISAMPAGAATLLDITVTGTIGPTQPCAPSEAAQNTCQDANLATGDTITLSAVIDASALIDNGDGTQTALVYYLLPEAKASGPEYFQVTAGGLTWEAHNVNDNPLKTWITIQDGKVVDVFGDLLYGPELLMGGAGGTATDNPASFYIDQPDCMYNDCYSTPGFTGVWDFADSTVTDPAALAVADAVPEPSAWIMMLLGFAMIGSALRRRQVPLSFTL